MPHPWNEDVRGTQVPVLVNSDAATIRCVAGPGSGKTFGLVRRVERILHPAGLGVDGHDVLVVAFNRVIARQLRDEVHARRTRRSPDSQRFKSSTLGTSLTCIQG
jgi:DNA helicase II / ATP-dependent DNA helicase PcrA